MEEIKQTFQENKMWNLLEKKKEKKDWQHKKRKAEAFWGRGGF